VLLPNTDERGARSVAEKIRRAVENTKISDPRTGLTTKLTVSVGASTAIYGQDTTVEDFISKADNALYEAKASGRNRVSY
jgi:diguanylate cyclase (GGDEF)-like protein